MYLNYLLNELKFFVDFRYYEDPSDQFRKKGEGTLMLMWTMVFKNDKVFIVTDMCWNPIYFDMIAITISIRKYIKQPCFKFKPSIKTHFYKKFIIGVQITYFILFKLYIIVKCDLL